MAIDSEQQPKDIPKPKRKRKKKAKQNNPPNISETSIGSPVTVPNKQDFKITVKIKKKEKFKKKVQSVDKTKNAARLSEAECSKKISILLDDLVTSEVIYDLRNNSQQISHSVPKKKSPKPLKGPSEKIKEIPSKDQENSNGFVFNEIAHNKEASALIHDLVKCFTSSTVLPKQELDILNKTLHEKTVSVFVSALNNCVEKVFNRLLCTKYFKDLVKKEIVKKDASCQTDDGIHNS